MGSRGGSTVPKFRRCYSEKLFHVYFFLQRLLMIEEKYQMRYLFCIPTMILMLEYNENICNLVMMIYSNRSFFKTRSVIMFCLVSSFEKYFINVNKFCIENTWATFQDLHSTEHWNIISQTFFKSYVKS